MHFCVLPAVAQLERLQPAQHTPIPVLEPPQHLVGRRLVLSGEVGQRKVEAMRVAVGLNVAHSRGCNRHVACATPERPSDVRLRLAVPDQCKRQHVRACRDCSAPFTVCSAAMTPYQNGKAHASNNTNSSCVR